MIFKMQTNMSFMNKLTHCHVYACICVWVKYGYENIKFETISEIHFRTLTENIVDK